MADSQNSTLDSANTIAGIIAESNSAAFKAAGAASGSETAAQTTKAIGETFSKMAGGVLIGSEALDGAVEGYKSSGLPGATVGAVEGAAHGTAEYGFGLGTSAVGGGIVDGVLAGGAAGSAEPGFGTIAGALFGGIALPPDIHPAAAGVRGLIWLGCAAAAMGDRRSGSGWGSRSPIAVSWAA